MGASQAAHCEVDLARQPSTKVFDLTQLQKKAEVTVLRTSPSRRVEEISKQTDDAAKVKNVGKYSQTDDAAKVKNVGKYSFDDIGDEFVLPPGNVVKGKKLFVKYCSQCHSIYEDNRMTRGGQFLCGPTLFNIYGRASGISEAEGVQDASMPEGIVWLDIPLMNYMKNPRLAAGGNVQMNFAGLSSVPQRIDIIHYMKTLDHTMPAPPEKPKIWGVI